MWGLVPLRGGIEPPAQRFAQRATIGRPSSRFEHIARLRFAQSCYMLSPLLTVRSGSPSSLRSSAAFGVRRPAWGAGGRPDPQPDRFSGLRRVASRYARRSSPPRQRPWRGGRATQPTPTHNVRTTYMSLTPDQILPT